MALLRIARRVLRIAPLLVLAIAVPIAGATVPQVPLQPGTTIVVAVSNAPAAASPGAQPANAYAQGDYDVVVAITGIDANGYHESAFIDATDAAGVRRQVIVPRTVAAADLEDARQQLLGFAAGDPKIVAGTTSLGPSLAVVRDLRGTGRSNYAFRNYLPGPLISGQLRRIEDRRGTFSVLLNGKRVDLPAIFAHGQMSAGASTRPFEIVIFDDPQHPLSLRIAYGPRDGGFPFEPDFAREIVRIDFREPQAVPLADALQQYCRVEVPGIYFDFDQATLKPPSRRALEDIAAVLRGQPAWRLSIEGHTDNIGGERYNDELSARRAAAVKTALVETLQVDGPRLTTRGFGLRKPVETNATLAGRARNRRVELVRDCGAGR